MQECKGSPASSQHPLPWNRPVGAEPQGTHVVGARANSSQNVTNLFKCFWMIGERKYPT
jgi:hypothetical protein